MTHRCAVLGSRLSEVSETEEKIRIIFQAMLTREPTAIEFEIARVEIEKFGDEAYPGLAWALLNAQQFLYVQ